MATPLEKHRLLRVMPLGVVAEVILDPDTPVLDKFNAVAMLRHRLREYNGAMWIGALLHERNVVINALRAS